MSRLLVVIFFLSSILYASGEHTGNHLHDGKPMNHSTSDGSIALLEAGNDAFGTIQEVIIQLQNDPNTNWKNVNIEALRTHLIDMYDMTMNVEVVSQKNIQDGSEVIIKAITSRAEKALERVFMAHPSQLKKETGWTMKAELKNQSYTIITTSPNKKDIDKIRGLGYIGLMAHGKHHQPHHWMMATGKNPHSH